MVDHKTVYGKTWPCVKLEPSVPWHFPKRIARPLTHLGNLGIGEFRHQFRASEPVILATSEFWSAFQYNLQNKRSSDGGTLHDGNLLRSPADL